MFQFLKNIFSRKYNNHVIVKIRTQGENVEIDVNGKKEIRKGTIRFEKNEIIIGNDDGIQITNIPMNTPQEIQYQQQSYHLTKDELFAIFIMQFIREIEKIFVIDFIDIITNKTTS